MHRLMLATTAALITAGGAASWTIEHGWYDHAPGTVEHGWYEHTPFDERDGACVQNGDPLRAEFRRIAGDQEVAGAAVGVLLDGRIVLTEYIGSADLDARTPVTAETQFGIASVTKAFTGMAAWRLVRDGVLDLDRPISSYGEFKPAWTASLTPRMLLTHVAGLPHPNQRTPQLFATHYDDIAAALEVFKDVEPMFPAGTRYAYSSSNYNLLGAVMQAAAGKPFDRLVHELVIDPAGLTRSGFDDARTPRPGRAERYALLDPWTYRPVTDLRRVPTWDYSFNMAGGNMYATLSDLLRFGGWMLETVRANPGLLEPLRQGTDSASRSPWSYGWFTGTREGLGPRLGISGSNPGVLAALDVYPERGLAVAALTNTWGKNARSGAIIEVERFGRMCLDG